MLQYLYLGLITFAEATIGIFVKLTGGHVPIMSLNFYRVFFALIFIALAMPFINKKCYQIKKKDILPTAIIGFLIAAQISIFNLAMSMAPVANVVIFWSIAPFFVFIFSSLFLRVRPKKQHVFIFLIAFIGILIANPLQGLAAPGNLIALFDGAVYAAMVTYIRYENRGAQVDLVFWFMLTACIYLVPSLFIFGFGDLGKMLYYESINLSVPVITWVICLGALSTGIAFFFINIVLRHIDATVYSLVDIIVSPVVAGILAYFIFTEVPGPNMIYGGALLLISGFWLTLEMNKDKKGALKQLYERFILRKPQTAANPWADNRQIK